MGQARPIFGFVRNRQPKSIAIKRDGSFHIFDVVVGRVFKVSFGCKLHLRAATSSANRAKILTARSGDAPVLARPASLFRLESAIFASKLTLKTRPRYLEFL